VEEGKFVKSGKVIAKMGRRDNIAKLHFEIRRNGKPVDPIKYLPNQ
jgi:lipoprotein NlpD